jgi:hypothetical protein
MQGTQFTKKKLTTYADFCFFELNLFPSRFFIQNLGGFSAKEDSTENKKANRTKTIVSSFIGIQII